jgi:hypothetical protein
MSLGNFQLLIVWTSLIVSNSAFAIGPQSWFSDANRCTRAEDRRDYARELLLRTIANRDNNYRRSPCGPGRLRFRGEPNLRALGIRGAPERRLDPRQAGRVTASYYGDGTDGFANQPTACSTLMPRSASMNPRAMIVAVRRSIFNALMFQTRNGQGYRTKANICGSDIYISANGTTVRARVVDLGDLGEDSPEIQPMRDLDLSPAVRDALRIPSGKGIQDVMYDICYNDIRRLRADYPGR